MATSPFIPVSLPDFSGAAGNIASGPHTGTTNSRKFLGIGYVVASLSANASIWQAFKCLAAPSNTVKLLVPLLANATTGNARINLEWASGVSPYAYDTATLTAEGVATVSWAAGDAEDIKEHKITMDHSTISAGDIVMCRLLFETASWTLAQKMHVGILSIIDE